MTILNSIALIPRAQISVGDEVVEVVTLSVENRRRCGTPQHGLSFKI